MSRFGLLWCHIVEKWQRNAVKQSQNLKVCLVQVHVTYLTLNHF